MDREILFRGKRVDNGEWVEGDYSHDPDLETSYISGYDYYTDGDGLQRNLYGYEIIPETRGEYTGLTDKNGKKIFEGDLIIEINGMDIDKTPRKVVWANLSYMCPYIKNYWGYGDSCVELDFLYRLKRGNIEVIGNIHDNPELLKEAQHEYNE